MTVLLFFQSPSVCNFPINVMKSLIFKTYPSAFFSPWHLFYLPESPKADPFLQMDLINLSNSASTTKESNICTDGTRALHHLYKKVTTNVTKTIPLRLLTDHCEVTQDSV